MTIQPGDPNGIAEHNDLADAVAALAAQQGVVVDLPPVAVLGAQGHVDAHNKLRAALEKIATEGGITWAAATGGTESTITADGKNWRLHVFTTNGTLTVSKAGYAEVLLVGAGGTGNSDDAGQGAHVRDGIHQLPAGSLTVTVGQPGSPNGLSGASSIGTLSSGQAAYGIGSAGVNNGPLTTTITGSVMRVGGRAGEGGGSTYGQGGGTVNAAGQPGVVIVRYQI